jgi:hypothetical protein
LSERALAEVCMTGARPVHLDRCDLCAERAVQLGRWLDDLRTVAVNDADAAFPAERLVAQQVQILRRLEQLDRPARVIAFPAQSQADRLAMGGQGVRPAWIGIAAAAGVVLGLLGGQMNLRLSERPIRSAVQPVPTESPVQAIAYQAPPSLREFDESDTVSVDVVDAMDHLIPRASQLSSQSETVR